MIANVVLCIALLMQTPTPSEKLNWIFVAQGVIIVLLGAGSKWLLNLKSTIDVMKRDDEHREEEIDKMKTHMDTAHVHPAAFESMRVEVNSLSKDVNSARTEIAVVGSKMDLVWRQMTFERDNKIRDKGGD